MSLWGRVRGLRWWWRLSLAAVALPIGLALLYVAVRSLLYLGAEGDAGLHAPASVHATVRVRGLAGHLDRLEGSFAWRSIDRKILGDPAVKPLLNAALRDAGLPTLDDLRDPRKSAQFSRENLLRAAGRDLVAGVAAPADWKTARFCVATKLRWSDYLLAPFAPLVLKKDGETLKAGRQLWVAFEGAIAIAGNDKALVEEARLGRGRAPEGRRPVEAGVRFDGSRPLAALRDEAQRMGVLPHLKLETVRALKASADLEGTAARVDVEMEGVEERYPSQGPPDAFLELAPAATTGLLGAPASFRDVFAAIKAAAPASKASNVQQAIEQLERGGLSDRLLPLVEPGLGLITGYQENNGKLFPCFALLVRTSDPAKASEALLEVVLKIGGPQAKKNHRADPVGDARLHWVEWPGAVGAVNDFFQPCWAAVDGGLLFGNNRAFTEAAVRATGEGGDLWKDRRSTRRLRQRLKELGFAERPARAGGVLVPPLLRESLDGVLDWLAGVAAVPSDTALRQELEREWAQQGRSGLPETEKSQLFQDARKARVEEYEAELRRSLRGLEPLRWAAFETAPSAGGVTLRLAVGFDSLTDR